MALNSELRYYSIDSSLTFTSLSSITEATSTTGVQFNPSDATRFLKCFINGGVRSYSISSDVITLQESVLISADLVYVAHYASGSTAIVNSYTPKTLFMISISGNAIYLFN